MEESLLRNEAILNDPAAFHETIDYEFVHSSNDWYVREKKVYSKYLRTTDPITMDSKGNICDISLESLGVVLVNDSSTEAIEK
jgi:hypothetical protein